MTQWIEETLYDDYQFRFRAEEIIYDSQTEHQRLVLFENKAFGKILTLDGVTQVTERDEFIYHEMLAHLPILAHGAARKVLIVGGGDGGMLEEVLKHDAVTKATLVDIDAGVIEFAKTHLRSICKEAFEDPRTEVIIADAAVFVADCRERYDVVIIDSTDPIGPGEALFTKAFYSACKSCLAPGGILVTQNGVPFVQADELTNTLGFLGELFETATCYLATVPTYVGGPMAFGWASDDGALLAPSLETLQDRFRAAQIDTRYYTPAVHLAAFALPGYVAQLLPAR